MTQPHFNGPAYDPRVDLDRLTKQIWRVYSSMTSGVPGQRRPGEWGRCWLTLGELAASTGDPESSVSAQLRHLRKARFGGFIVSRRHRGKRSSGLWEYQLNDPPEPQPDPGRLF